MPDLYQTPSVTFSSKIQIVTIVFNSRWDHAFYLIIKIYKSNNKSTKLSNFLARSFIGFFHKKHDEDEPKKKVIVGNTSMNESKSKSEQ